MMTHLETSWEPNCYLDAIHALHRWLPRPLVNSDLRGVCMNVCVCVCVCVCEGHDLTHVKSKKEMKP